MVGAFAFNKCPNYRRYEPVKKWLVFYKQDGGQRVAHKPWKKPSHSIVNRIVDKLAPVKARIDPISRIAYISGESRMEILSNSDLGLILRRAGLSRSEAAEACDVSVQTVTNWCSGRHYPDIERLGLIAALLLDKGIEVENVRALLLHQLGDRGMKPSVLDRLFSSHGTAAADIAIISWGAASAGVAKMAEVIHKIMKRAGASPLVFDCQRNSSLLRTAFEFATSERNFRGVVVFGPVRDAMDLNQIRGFALKAADHGTAIAVISSYPSDVQDLEIANISTIFWNQERLARDATKLLISEKRTSIGAIFHGASISFHRTNFNGFTAALAESGRTYREEEVIWGVGPDSRPSDSELRKLMSNCSAVFIDDYRLLSEVSRVLAASDIGADEFSIAVLGFPPISYAGIWPTYCVVEPMVELGELAAHVMLDLIRNSGSGELPQSMRVTLDQAPQIVKLNGEEDKRREHGYPG